MTASDRFDLNAVIRDVLSRGEAGADPDTIAKSVMRAIPPQAYGEALAQAMRQLVRTAMTQARMKTAVVTSPNASERPGGTAGPADAETSRSDRAAKPGRSYNREAVREHWRKALLDWECIDGNWKHYGQCTIDDLHWLRDDRYARAVQYTAKGDWYQHVAELLATHRVETVEELPESVLAATFQPRRDTKGEAA